MHRRGELMKRWTGLAFAAALALSVSACSGDRAPDANQNSTAAREGAAGTTGTSGTSGLSSGDAEFVRKQIAMGTTEVELGKLAQQRGNHADVKNYGQMMETDHRIAGEELKEIAQRADAKYAERHDAEKDAHDEHLELREELTKLSGRDFDRRYLDEMIADHEKGIDRLESQGQGADNPQIREWAGKTLLKMRNHLAKAKLVQETVKMQGDGKN
jgi:putative membrane protein